MSTSPSGSQGKAEMGPFHRRLSYTFSPLSIVSLFPGLFGGSPNSVAGGDFPPRPAEKTLRARRSPRAAAEGRGEEMRRRGVAGPAHPRRPGPGRCSVLLFCVGLEFLQKPHRAL